MLDRSVKVLVDGGSVFLPKRTFNYKKYHHSTSGRDGVCVLCSATGPPPDAYQAYITESSVACLLAVYYTLQTARTKDRVGLMRVLGCLSTSEGDRAFDDTFLHALVSRGWEGDRAGETRAQLRQ